MSTPTDLENRISAALAARAEQVRPEHISPTLLPAAAVPLRRRPLVVLAAAACVLLALGLTVWLPRHQDDVDPAPEPDAPEVVVPPDIGRGWDRARLSPPAGIDLDGDGVEEKVRFSGEPGAKADGRVRLDTTLSSDGSAAYGVVALGTTIGVAPLDPIDADGDGDEELVLYHSEDDMTTVPVVLDLRDGMLVEAPPTDPDLLRIGTTAEAGGTDLYDIVRLHDYWIEDGTLLSGSSVNTFAASGMSLFRPEDYLMDVVRWRLRDDGVLVPEPAATPCVVSVPEGRRPCRAGDADGLPVLAPVADDRVGVGEGFSVDTGYAFDVRVEPEPDAEVAVVVEGADGRTIRTPIRLGAELRVFTTQPSGLFHDGASLLVASEDGDEPSAMQVLVQDGDEMVVLEPVGATPLGTGYVDDRRAFRTWLTDNGELFTAVATSEDGSGPWEVWSWVVAGPRSMTAVPRATLCFDDVADPSTGHRC
ncbi:hypothetical protein [Nocardioides currus]|uniref:Uncharacterized protein n=1 Tax=Nocardioides currus TaxID=2133958 RepID=A0A2R7YV37_9ACTN|nr:hypothetical protein [Nocardioides currus]PUA80277.1 hypothetical protein C7S10_14145 [Nocardioides currus]